MFIVLHPEDSVWERSTVFGMLFQNVRAKDRLGMFNPFQASGIFHKAKYNKSRMVCFIYLGVTG